MACVYKHIRLDTGDVFYIGIGNKTERAYNKKNRSQYWKYIFNKTDINVEIAIDNISYEEAKSWEVYLIGLYGRKDLNNGGLVNMTNGGDGAIGSIKTAESRKKMSESMKGKKKSPEEVLKMSERVRGEKNPFYGKKRPELSVRMSGPNNPMYGKKNYSVSGGKHPMARKVTDGVNTWDCMRDAANSIGMKYETMKSQLYGKVSNRTNLRFL